MRKFILLILIVLSIDGFNVLSAADKDSVDTYQVIGDSVFFKNGSTCHIDNFTDGKCESNSSWWDINYLSFWTGLLIPFVFFGYMAFSIKRKINKRKKA